LDSLNRQINLTLENKNQVQDTNKEDSTPVIEIPPTNFPSQQQNRGMKI
jgi:hypothetical protein